MTTENASADGVALAVNAAIEGATVTPDAPEGERVAFQRDELALVARLYNADSTRERTWRAVQARVGLAIDAIIAKESPPSGDDPDWRAVTAGNFLHERLGQIASATYALAADGTLSVRARRLLGGEPLG
jgi:hypothetical protein